MINQKYAFAIENVNIIEENPNSKFAIVELDFFASGENLNNMYVSEETLARTAHTIKGCPLIWSYDEILDDAYTHSDAETPCGFVPETAEIKSKKLEDGRTMLSTIAYVWKRYTGQLLEIFKRDAGRKPVSVEMIVQKMQRLPNGLRELLDFNYEGITILGSFVTPGIPGARVQVLSFSKELEEEYIEDFKKEFSDEKIRIDPSFLKELKEGESILPPQAGEIIDNNIEEMEMNMNKDKNLGQPEAEEQVEAQTEKNLENSIPMAEEKKPEKEEPKGKEKPEGDEEPKGKEKPEGDEKPEGEEKSEDDEKPKDMKKEKEKYSIWGAFDFGIVKGLFAEGDGFAEFRLEAEKGLEARPEIILQGVMEKLSLAEKRIEELSGEVDELKLFKHGVEESQKAFTVERTLQELSEKVVIPDEEREKMIAEANNYSLDNLEAWKNHCKAVSFEFAPKTTEKPTIEKIGLPHGKTRNRKKDDLWS